MLPDADGVGAVVPPGDVQGTRRTGPARREDQPCGHAQLNGRAPRRHHPGTVRIGKIPRHDQPRATFPEHVPPRTLWRVGPAGDVGSRDTVAVAVGQDPPSLWRAPIELDGEAAALPASVLRDSAQIGDHAAGRLPPRPRDPQLSDHACHALADTMPISASTTSNSRSEAPRVERLACDASVLRGLGIARPARIVKWGRSLRNDFSPIPWMFIRSSSFLNGPFFSRYATMRCAMLGPMPGKASNWATVAALTFTDSTARRLAMVMFVFVPVAYC